MSGQPACHACWLRKNELQEMKKASDPRDAREPARFLVRGGVIPRDSFGCVVTGFAFGMFSAWRRFRARRWSLLVHGPGIDRKSRHRFSRDQHARWYQVPN